MGDRAFSVSVPAQGCAACGELRVDAAEMGRAELAVARTLVNAGEVSKEAFKFIRKALGFSATALADELGVNAKTIARWESGDVAVDPLAWLAVAALVGDEIEGRTTTRDRLRAVRERPGLAKTVRIEVPPREIAGSSALPRGGRESLLRARDIILGPTRPFVRWPKRGVRSATSAGLPRRASVASSCSR